MVAELKAEQPKLYRKMIVERNRNWLPRIDGLSEESGNRIRPGGCRAPGGAGRADRDPQEEGMPGGEAVVTFF